MTESSIGYGEWRYQRYDMSVYASSLTNRAALRPVAHLVFHVGPAVSLLDQRERGFNPAVTIAIEDMAEEV